MTTKTKRVPRRVREQQMLDAAVVRFARQGYRAASMDEIAEQAGVSKPLVYLYLNSKEELFTACVQREASALTAAVRRGAEPGADPERRLRGGLRGFFSHTARHPEGWAVLNQQARTQGEPFARQAATMREEIVGFVTEQVSAASRAANRDAGRDAERVDREIAGLAHALVGAAESLADWANRVPGQTPNETTAILMNFAWPGLRRLLATSAGERRP